MVIALHDADFKHFKKAASSFQRLDSLRIAKWRGINTWVSCEPVIEPQSVYALIQSANYIDLYRIGKLNHADTPVKVKRGKRAEFAEFIATYITEAEVDESGDNPLIAMFESAFDKILCGCETFCKYPDE